MVWLAGLGFAALCLHLAIIPLLAAAGLVARMGGGGARRLVVSAALGGVASVLIIVVNWPAFDVILRATPARAVFAGLGGLVVARAAFLAIRHRLATRLGTLPSEGPEQHLALAAALSDAADAVELHDVPKLAVVDCVASPAVTGFRRPVLLFPTHLESLKPDRLQIVLAHELAHIKLGHLLWCHVVSGLAAILWPNPLARWAKESLSLMMESEADQKVADLNFTQSQIRETRDEVMSFLRSPHVSLAFAPHERPATPAAPFRSALRLALEALALPIGVACALLPQMVLARPSLLGLGQDLDQTANPYAFQFATPAGDWARSRYDAVFVRGGNLYRMQGDGSQVRALRRPRTIGEPSVSRDGTRIVWVQDNDLYLADGDGEILERLTDTPDQERHPWLSPDGTQVVYSVLGGASFTENQILLRDLQTGQTANLSRKIGPGIEPSFSRDGKSILYMNEGNIFRAYPEEGIKEQLTYVRNRGGAVQTDLHGPIESPDRQWIAVTRVHGDLEGNWYSYDPNAKHWEHRTISVWVMRSDGTGFRELTPPQMGIDEYSVFDIAPTGIWVACGRGEPASKGTKGTLWEFDLLTGQHRQYLSDEFFSGLVFTGWLR